MASTIHHPSRQATAVIPALPPPSPEDQRRKGNAFYQKALRAGRIHGSSSNPATTDPSSTRDAIVRGSRNTEDGSVTGRHRRKDTAGGTETKGRREGDVVLEGHEIVKRDANGQYESFLTVGGQVFQDIVLDGERICGGIETEEDRRQRDRGLLELYRSQRGQQLDLTANMAYLREKTNSLDDDNWMFESEDATREHTQ
ncbi:MAG: hypothetical protein Q9157_000919 [Trypethelium eluteriae]